MAFAGLKFQDVGSFDYGRNYGVVYDVTSWTDVLPEFGGDTYGSDNFMQQRGNGFATYRNTDFFGLVDGLNFAVQYQGKNGNPSGEGFTSGVTNNGRDALRQNGDGVGGSITYDYEGFGIGGAISSSKRTDAQNTAAYIGNGDRPSLAYLQSKGKNLGRGYDDEDILKYVDVGATYYFNKNMSTYVDYKINLLDDNQFTRDAGINTDNIVALGLVYQF